MVKGSIKKSIAAIISAAAITVSAFCAGAFSGCTVKTDHPAAQITIEFAEKTYTLNYTLYRNMYPGTVQHFIELADNGFYNDIVIHDYKSGGDWFTGGYSYNATNYAAWAGDDGRMSEYFSMFSLENKYNDLAKSTLTPTVYADRDARQPLNTLIGEFSENQHKIENGALRAEYGCLKMFYYEKNTTKKVYAMHHDNQLAFADYKYNCATSLFTLQTGSSSSYGVDKYCVFATVDDADAFRQLVDDVKNYFEEKGGSGASDYSVNANVLVDKTENYSDKENDANIEMTFKATNWPIVIKSVKITKY